MKVRTQLRSGGAKLQRNARPTRVRGALVRSGLKSGLTIKQKVVEHT